MVTISSSIYNTRKFIFSFYLLNEFEEAVNIWICFSLVFQRKGGNVSHSNYCRSIIIIIYCSMGKSSAPCNIVAFIWSENVTVQSCRDTTNQLIGNSYWCCCCCCCFSYCCSFCRESWVMIRSLVPRNTASHENVVFTNLRFLAHDHRAVANKCSCWRSQITSRN